MYLYTVLEDEWIGCKSRSSLGFYPLPVGPLVAVAHEWKHSCLWQNLKQKQLILEKFSKKFCGQENQGNERCGHKSYENPLNLIS